MSKAILQGLSTEDLPPNAPQTQTTQTISPPIFSEEPLQNTTTNGEVTTAQEIHSTTIKVPIVQTIPSHLSSSPPQRPSTPATTTSPRLSQISKVTVVKKNSKLNKKVKAKGKSKTKTKETGTKKSTINSNSTKTTNRNRTTRTSRVSRPTRVTNKTSPNTKHKIRRTSSGSTSSGGSSGSTSRSNNSSSSNKSKNSNSNNKYKKSKKSSPRKSSLKDTSRTSSSSTDSNRSVDTTRTQAAKAKALRLRGNRDSRDSTPSHSVLTKTNFLIQTAEVLAEPITSLRELEQCAASMFVAIFESMFRVRLRGIVREPQRLQDYAQNAQLVIDAISSAFHVDIRHINGNLICDGHRASISTLVDVFIEILTEKVSSRRGRSRSRSEERQQFRESRSPGSRTNRTAGSSLEGEESFSRETQRRRRPTSAPPTERRQTPSNRGSTNAQDKQTTAKKQQNTGITEGNNKNTTRLGLKKRNDRNSRNGRNAATTKKKTTKSTSGGGGGGGGGERTSSTISKKKKKKSSMKKKTRSRQTTSSEAMEQSQSMYTDASQLVMVDEMNGLGNDGTNITGNMSLMSDRQNVSSQYLAAAAMAAATAALDAHAAHDIAHPDDFGIEEEEDEGNVSIGLTEDEKKMNEEFNNTNTFQRTSNGNGTTTTTTTTTKNTNNTNNTNNTGNTGNTGNTSNGEKTNVLQHMTTTTQPNQLKQLKSNHQESSPLWEAQDDSAMFENQDRNMQLNESLDDDDLSRVLDRIASLDTSSEAGNAIAKPLWDMLLRSGSLAAEEEDIATNAAAGTMTRRQIRQTEIRKRHRMYKKLLKAQIKALKIEQVDEVSVISTSGEMGDGGAFDMLRSSTTTIDGQPLSPNRIRLRSSGDMHQARVDLIRETRLKKELRRAAKARLIRKKQREELVVDKLFTAALKDERRRLAVERAEIRRSRKKEEEMRQDKILAIEHQYTAHRKMLAEQVRMRQKERTTAKRAQKMEFKSMTRELRDEKRQRFTQLIEQLDRQDQQDQESDWVSGLGAELEGKTEEKSMTTKSRGDFFIIFFLERKTNFFISSFFFLLLFTRRSRYEWQITCVINEICKNKFTRT